MRKKGMLIGLIFLVFVLVGCSLITDNKGGMKTIDELGGVSEDVTVDTVIEKFKAEGLEVGGVSDLDNSQFGNTREEGKRILIPSLGDDNGGRLYRFSDDAKLQQAKSYYDEISNTGPLLYTHTHQSGNLLLQMNGEMSDEDFAKYAVVLDTFN